MSAEPLVVGVDFGTLSARAVVVRASDGTELVSPYYQQVVQGIVLGIAILLDRLRASYFGRGRR